MTVADWPRPITNHQLKIHSKADLDLINVAHLATFAADCTEASENYYQQGINFAADLQFLVNAVESTVTSLDEVSDPGRPRAHTDCLLITARPWIYGL